MADGEPPEPPPLLEGGVKHIPPPKHALPSFSEIIQGATQKDSSPFLDPSTLSLKPTSIYQGKLAVVFKNAEKKLLLDSLPFVLVGKFSHGRPPFSAIKVFFTKLKLKGKYNISLYDSKHLFIDCALQIDFVKIWLKLSWFINGKPMRILKWEPNFSPLQESPIAPVWVRFVGLPLYMFEEKTLLSISNSIGRPLKVDPLNVSRVVVNSARVCVELDVSKPLIDFIWVCIEDDESQEILDKFRVQVIYDVLPSFCSSCVHLGHGLNECKKKKFVEVKLPGKSKTDVNSAVQVFDEMPVTTVNSAGQVLDEMPLRIAEPFVEMKLPWKSETDVNSAVQVFDEMHVTTVNSAGQVFDEMPLRIAEPFVEIKLPGKSETDVNSAVQVFDEMPETKFNSAGHVFDEMPLRIAEPNLAAYVRQQINNKSSSVVTAAGRGQHIINNEQPVAHNATKLIVDDTDQVVAGGACEVFDKMSHPEKTTAVASLQEDSFTTPETSKTLPRTTTPPSWADLVEEEEPLPQIITQLDATQVTDYAKKLIETIMQDPIATKKNRVKAKKGMSTDLPIQAEPLIEVDNGEMVKLSQLPYNLYASSSTQLTIILVEAASLNSSLKNQHRRPRRLRVLHKLRGRDNTNILLVLVRADPGETEGGTDIDEITHIAEPKPQILFLGFILFMLF